MGLSLDIGANTRAAVRNVGDVGEALSKVADSLDDLAREADRDAGRVETSLDDAGDSARGMGRDVESAGDRVERTFEDMVRDAKKADRAVSDIGDNSGKSLGKIKDGAREVQNEFGQNLAESVSSVRGDISELGQVGQDTLGGLAGTVAGMGPAGLVGAFALAAGAVGLGAVTAGIEEAEEKQQKLNETAAKFAEGYIAGVNGAIDSAQVFAEINSIATDPERYKVASQNAKNWGVDVSTAMRAMAGDSTALGTVDAALERQADALEANANGADNYAQSIEAATTGQSSANSTYLAGRDALDGLKAALALGADQAANAQRALYDYAVQVGDATGRTDELGNAILVLPGGKEVVINAQTQTAYQEVDAFEKRQIQDKTVSVKADVSGARRVIEGLNGMPIYLDVRTQGSRQGVPFY